MLKTFANGTIEYFIDRERRVVFGRWEGEIWGDELVAALPSLWRDHPEIGRSSAVYDMLDYTAILEPRYVREMIRLRSELVGGFDPQSRTAVVTADPGKAFEIKMTQASAPDRLFRLFGSSAEALEWILADEPDNPCAGLRDKGGAVPWWFERKPAGKIARVR